MLNLLNMSDKEIEKFRLRKAHASMVLNTIYMRREGRLYILEKNLHANAKLVGTKKAEIPVEVQATQRVTRLQVDGVKAMGKDEITKRIRRQIVEIY